MRGEGARSHVTVILCRIHVPTSRLVAIKIINLEDSNDDIAEIQLEISHLAACDSPWVTKYYGSFLRGWKLWIGELAERRPSCCIAAAVLCGICERYNRRLGSGSHDLHRSDGISRRRIMSRSGEQFERVCLSGVHV
jgi:serine/threonine protein kinase